MTGSPQGGIQKLGFGFVRPAALARQLESTGAYHCHGDESLIENQPFTIKNLCRIPESSNGDGLVGLMWHGRQAASGDISSLGQHAPETRMVAVGETILRSRTSLKVGIYLGTYLDLDLSFKNTRPP